MGELVLYEYNFDKPELSNELLIHYGIKGMRWGVRRYQNYDGTRIKKGSKRVINKSKLSKSSIRKADREAEKKRIQKRKDEIAYMSRHPDKYSTKDINEKLNRINAETRLRDLNHQLNPTTGDRIKKITSNKAFKAVAITALAAGIVTVGGMAMYKQQQYPKELSRYSQMIKSGRYLTDSKNMPIPPNPDLKFNKQFFKGFKKNYPINLYNIGIKKIYDKMGIGNYFKGISR